MITDPIGKSVFFIHLTNAEGIDRKKAALKVSMTVAVILGGAALAGRELFELMGIHLGAFEFIGGAIVTGMGLEMLGLGSPSRVQGGKKSWEEPSSEDSLFVPFSMPFIAGPGAITMVITLAAKTDGWDSTVMTLVAVCLNVALMIFSFTVLSDYIQKLSDQAVSIMVRFGGLIVATIGTQLAFNGIKNFFGL